MAWFTVSILRQPITTITCPLLGRVRRSATLTDIIAALADTGSLTSSSLWVPLQLLSPATKRTGPLISYTYDEECLLFCVYFFFMPTDSTVVLEQVQL